MLDSSTLQFVSVKAFGDFVIALTAVERAIGGARPIPSIVASDHLRPLVEATAPKCRVTFLSNADEDVPAIFDLRRKGVAAAVRSAVGLKRAIERSRDLDATLVLDKLGWRERWLTLRAPSLSLPHTANIYAAYGMFLATAEIAPMPSESDSKVPGRGVVGIFPGSRIAAKNLPLDLVRSVLAAVEGSGRQGRLYLLDGERPDLERSGMPFVAVPRRFEALIAAIEDVETVIGADSLPVHLAERYSRPVFVFSPRHNTFWLPHSSWSLDHWALFDASPATRLTRFLDMT